MLERREAELREAMKLRHSLTTLLHGLRVDMEHVRERRKPLTETVTNISPSAKNKSAKL